MVWYIAAAVMTPGPLAVFLTLTALWFMIGSASIDTSSTGD